MMNNKNYKKLKFIHNNNVYNGIRFEEKKENKMTNEDNIQKKYMDKKKRLKKREENKDMGRSRSIAVTRPMSPRHMMYANKRKRMLRLNVTKEGCDKIGYAFYNISNVFPTQNLSSSLPPKPFRRLIIWTTRLARDHICFMGRAFADTVTASNTC